jgi:hypothetical protein
MPSTNSLFLPKRLADAYFGSGTFKMLLVSAVPTEAELDAWNFRNDVTNEITGSGYTAGGQGLTGRSVGRSGRTVWLRWNDPVWEVASIAARGCLIYNATRANRAVAVYNFGQDVQSTAAAFSVQWPPAAPDTALVRIT